MKKYYLITYKYPLNYLFKISKQLAVNINAPFYSLDFFILYDLFIKKITCILLITIKKNFFIVKFLINYSVNNLIFLP